jgi:SnoaL-like polyketide cyclase/SnoaL-like domain
MSIPSPTSIAHAKSIVWAALQALPGNTAQGPTATSAAPALATFFDPQCEWHCFHPINQLLGTTQIDAQFWQPLLHAMPNMERRVHTFFAGEFDGHICGGAGTWATATGYLMGTMERDWLGIPATGDTIHLRIGEFYRVEGNKIVEARVLLDIVDVMRQAGFNVLPPSSGLDILVPGPQWSDGLLLGAQDAAVNAKTMQVLMGMMGGLGTYNQKDLKSMNVHGHWHPEMMWYGPCGIGTSRQVAGFQKHHQKPFLHAFPDRVGANHRARIAEGMYVASTGWPSVKATHAGDYLGAPATQRPITMRVADWWRREGDVLRENWVLIDLPNLLLQMDVDLFGRLAEQVAARKPLLNR